MPASLIPATVTARAERRGRLPFAFGPRFFIVLLLGLVWLVPAWWSSQFIAVMFVWDALALMFWLVDLYRLPAPQDLEARRSWSAPPSLSQPATVIVEVDALQGASLETFLVDETPVSLREAPPQLNSLVPARIEYAIIPRTRGNHIIGKLYVRYRTSLGMAERWATANLNQTIRVLPSIEQARQNALYLIRSRQVEMEKRRKRQRGQGREFETLREYRPGDDIRDMCWTATARRHQLTTRIFQTERSQSVWIILDAGRLLRAQVTAADRPFPIQKLDYAVDAALSVAQVASQSGDKVGLIAYGRTVQQSVGLGRGPQHIRTLLDSLSLVTAEASEANHARAVRTLMTAQNRRSLILWITDFAETATTPEVIEYAMHLTRRHLVVLAAVTQPDLNALAAAIPQTEEEMFRHAAALEIAERRERLLRRPEGSRRFSSRPAGGKSSDRSGESVSGNQRPQSDLAPSREGGDSSRHTTPLAGYVSIRPRCATAVADRLRSPYPATSYAAKCP